MANHQHGSDHHVVAKVKRYYNDLVASHEGKDVKEIAANIGAAGGQ